MMSGVVDRFYTLFTSSLSRGPRLTDHDARHANKAMSNTTHRRMCEFQLLRYVPDAVRDEGVHIGVILREQGSAHAEVRFTHDWRRVRCLDPDADTALLEGMESELRLRLH